MIELPDFSELTFEEKAHRYLLNGFEIPSVTTIMRPLSDAHYKTVDDDVLSEVLKCTPERPVFGHRSGKSSNTHWMLFFKEDNKNVPNS